MACFDLFAYGGDAFGMREVADGGAEYDTLDGGEGAFELANGTLVDICRGSGAKGCGELN